MGGKGLPQYFYTFTKTNNPWSDIFQQEQFRLNLKIMGYLINVFWSKKQTA
jgi:hypothetical protein